MPLSEIVLATRYGEESTAPARVTARLARQLDARVTVLYVAPAVTLAEMTSAEAGAQPEQARARARDEVSAELRAFAAEHLTGVETTIRIVEDDVAQGVAAVARDTGADFIVVGTKGRGGLARLVLGDTAHSILQHTPCPVVVVPLHEREAD